MNKGKLKRAALCGALCAVAGVCGILAYLSDTDTTANVFTVGSVSIELEEPSYPGNGSPETEKLLFYDEVDKDPEITNTGENDAIVFIRMEVPLHLMTLSEDDGTGTAEGYRDLFWYKQEEMDARSHRNSFDASWVFLEGAGTDTADSNSHTRTYVFGYKCTLKSGETTEALFDRLQLKKFRSRDVKSGEPENIRIQGFAIQSGGLPDGLSVPEDDGCFSEEALENIWEILMNQHEYR